MEAIIKTTIHYAAWLALLVGAACPFLPKRIMRIALGIAAGVWLLIGIFVFITQIIWTS